MTEPGVQRGGRRFGMRRRVFLLLALGAGVLPVEDAIVKYGTGTEGHIQGTTPMGDDPGASVVDRHLVHHRVRNLLVLGSSTFPTCPPANPTLTIAALSLWSARQLRT